MSEETMNFTNCTQANESVEEYLQHLEDKTNVALIPAVIMLSIFAVTGLIGNILVLVVYSKKFGLDATKVLIMTIASFDLVANVGAIPTEAYIILHSWNFSNAALCKFKVCLATFTTVGGAISLFVVAIVRYRKICRPHGWQVTIKQAQVSSVAVVAMTFIICIPYLIVSGVRTKETPCFNIKGHECLIEDRYFYTLWPLMSKMLLILMYVSFGSSFVVLYIRIGVAAWRHSRQHRLLIKGSKPKSNSESKNTGLAVDTESKRLQCQSQPSSLKRQKSVTGLEESTTDVDCNERSESSLICSLKHRKALDSENDWQSPITMPAFISDNDTKTTEHSPGTNSETINSRVTSSEQAGQKVECLKGNNAETNSEATCNASSTTRMGTTSMDRSSVFITEDLEKSGTQGRVNGLQNIDESNGDGKCTQNKLSTLNTSDVENGHIYENQEKHTTQTYLNKHQISTKRNSKSNSLGNSRDNTRSKLLGRMTVMLILISAVYILGFIPYLVLTILRNRQAEKIARFNMVESSVYNLFYRLYFINSAANPIIYSLCNIKFRRACIQLFTFTSRRRWM